MTQMVAWTKAIIHKNHLTGTECDITCPGFDGWSVKYICSGHGTCGDRGQCICDYGYVGDNCQFECPGFDPNNQFESAAKICGKKGSCTVADTAADSFREGDKRNKHRFMGALRAFYQPCNENFKHIERLVN